jgi:hypothetical protein
MGNNVKADAVISLSKAIYAATLTDLGSRGELVEFARQSSTACGISARVYNSQSIRSHLYWLLYCLQGSDRNNWGLPDSIPPPKQEQTFRLSSEKWQPLPAVTPSVVTAQYLCQIPQLKSAGSPVISIFVADIVFLQTLWQIFKLVVGSILERKHPEANYCQGCVKKLHQDSSQVKHAGPLTLVEAGKGPGVEVVKISTSAVAEDARHRGTFQDDAGTSPPARAATS